MPLQATSGAASYDAFGGGVAVVPNYIEEVFSTWLYAGNGSTQTINNGIDLAGKGGMTWFKGRDVAAQGQIYDSNRGVTKYLLTSLTNAEGTSGAGERLTAYNSNGFSLGTDPGSGINASPYNYVSWTFRKQPKFFDVVTYTGTGANRTVSHSLGSTPGCIIVKRTDSGGTIWAVYHQSLGATQDLSLNSTAAAGSSTLWNSTAPTSTQFTVGTLGAVNASGGTYVAYLFAHNAGGFGLTGTDNVISCGSFTTDGSGKATVDLGYEPQWVLFKNSGSAEDWTILDTMRGFNSKQSNLLFPNLSSAEVAAGTNVATPTATGFQSLGGQFASGSTVIYIAIRRGPMKVPTDGTKVFAPVLGNNVSTVGNSAFTTNFVVDSILRDQRSSGANAWMNRLTGATYLRTSTTNAEAVDTNILFDAMNGVNSGIVYNWTGTVGWNFRRAPGFFDEVCYTGTGTAGNQTHNLGVAPELVIIKQRSASADWWVLDYPLNGSLQLNNPYPANIPIPTNLSTGATATTFSLGNYSQVNGSGSTYVAYLFATCAGVSKVGSYTGTGTTQQINCGFTGGARFVMIKRADDTGLYTEGWYVWDSARGIVAGNDPYLLLNSTAAEVTSTDYIDTYSAGFEITSTAPAAINASSGTYIFLAIA